MTQTPAKFPRRILICMVGTAPAVLTETVYALATQDVPFIPTEIHVVSTSTGIDRVRAQLMPEGDDQLGMLCDDLGLSRADLQLTEKRLHVIQDERGPLADLSAASDHVATGDCLVRLIRACTQDEDSAVQVSIAGGRKTMGFYAGYTLSLLGRPQDRLTHVLVNPPFDTSRDFYFPPRAPRMITHASGRISTAEARVTLAEIPFIRMGSRIAQLTSSKAVSSFEALVRGAEKLLADIRVRVLLGKEGIMFEIDGKTFKLPVQHAVIYAMYLHRAMQGEEPLSDKEIRFSEHIAPLLNAHYPEAHRYRANVYDSFAEIDPSLKLHAKAGTVYDYEGQKNKLGVARSKIRKKLAEELGPLAEHCEVKNKRNGEGHGVRIPPEHIEFVRID